MLRKKLYKLLFIGIIITSFFTTAKANHLYDPRQKCEEISQYFNPEPGFPQYRGEDINPQQNCENNEHHERFPGQHKQNILSNGHQEPDRTSNQPWSVHNHRYFNDSVEGEDREGRKLYYQAAVDTFEIKLQQDFINNVNLNNVVCAGLPDNNNCEGEGNLGRNRNGDLVGYEVNFDKINGIITWHFPGSSHEGWAKPGRFGLNETLDQLMLEVEPDWPETSNEENRMLEVGINFETKNINEEFWSATTTSRILIKDFVARMRPGVLPRYEENGNRGDWEAIPHNGNLPGEENNYYWFPIGTVTTIWEKEIPNECIGINLTRADDPVTIEGQDAYKLTVNNINFEPGDVPAEAMLQWEAPSSGKFYRRNVNGTFTKLDTFDIAGGGQVLRINRNTDIFYVNPSGENNQRVTVTLVAGRNGEAYSAACKKSVEVPPQDLKPCLFLEASDAVLLSPQEVRERTDDINNWPMYKINLTELEFEDDEIPAGLKIKWETLDENNVGQFWVKLWDALLNTNLNEIEIDRVPVIENNQIFYRGPGPVKVSLSNIPNNLNNPGACTDTIPIVPPPQNVCTLLTAALDGEVITINGQDAHAIRVNSIFFAPENTIPESARIQWSSADPNGRFWRVIPSEPFIRQIANAATVQTVTRETRIYYTGEGPVNITLVNIPPDQIGGACDASVDIPEEVEICQEILVDHPVKILEGTYSKFKAQAINTDDEDMPNQISYSVDAGHGRFTLDEPQNIPENDAAMVRETSRVRGGVIGAGGGRLGEAVGAIANQTPLERVMKLLGDDAVLNSGAAFANVVIDLAVGQGEQAGAWPVDDPVDPSPEGNANPGNFSFNSIINAGNLGQMSAGNNFGPNANWINNLGINQGQLILNASQQIMENMVNAGNLNIGERIGLGAREQAPLNVAPGTEVYFIATEEGEDVVHVETVGTEVDLCSKDYDIEAPEEEQPICENLNFVRSIEGDVPAGQRVIIDINPVDEDGNPLPPETKVLISSTAGGTFLSMAIVPEEFEGSAEVRDFPMLFTGSNQAGTVSVQIDPEDPAFEAACTAEFEVIEEQEELVCTDLNYVLNETTTTTGATEQIPEGLPVERNSVYVVSADSSFIPPNADDFINYHIDPAYGAIINTNDIEGKRIQLKLLQSSTPLEKDSVQALGGAQLDFIKQDMTLLAGKPVLFVIYNSAPANIANALTIETEGTDVAACKKEVPLFIPPPPPEVCKQIILTTEDGTAFDPNAASTNFKLTGDFKNHNGNIEITISGSGKGTINKQGGPDEAEKIFFTPAEVAASNDLLRFTYKAKADFDPTEDSVTISVRAAGAPACEDTLSTVPEEKPVVCEDLEISNPERPWSISEEESEDDDLEQLFQIDVTADNEDQLYYHWTTTEGEWEESDSKTVIKQNDFVQLLQKFNGEEPRVEVWATASAASDAPKFKDENGNDICIDSIKLNIEKEEEEKPPEIEKFAYKNYKLRDAADVININEGVNNVGFISIMKIGEGSRSVKIKDSGLRNGIVKGSIEGRLVFEEMIIHVIEDNEEYTIYRTSGYTDERASNKFAEYSDDEFANYKKNMPFYKDKYSCEEGNNDTKFCIDIKKMDIEDDFAGIADEFKNGKPIFFKNLNKLDPDSRIVIKYQTIYPEDKRLNNEDCEDLKTSAGCGEKFKNTIEFQSYEDNEYQDELFDEEDSATVIAICPYVLTRQGGDVFFHDLIDTGIDVSKCAEVKSCEGVCITPQPPDDVDVPKTGSGDLDPLPDQTLTLDSENVCKFSNLEGNVKGYNDVLKNFSSTLCEFRAEVAEAWKLENINATINAGIQRISRFDTGSQSSGVEYENGGDIDVGTANLEKTIPGAGEPAAQTYITRNGDINILNNIKYGPTNFTDASNKIPSAAFIAIDGNIVLKNKNITQLDGVFIAIDLDSKDGNDVGKIIQAGADADGPDSFVCLTINGNLIGDVNELFKHRKCAGDYQTEESSVTIRYSSRILLNTPPGLKDLLNVQQALVP